MHIEALVDRVKVHQLDIVRLDLALCQPRGQFLEQFSRKFVVFDGSLQINTVSNCCALACCMQTLLTGQWNSLY